MAFEVVWSPTARFDFWDLISYISEDNADAGSIFGRKLLEAVEYLKDFPESGRVVPEFEDPAIREIIRKPFRIIYRVKHDRKLVQISRIWHASRGFPEV